MFMCLTDKIVFHDDTCNDITLTVFFSYLLKFAYSVCCDLKRFVYNGHKVNLHLDMDPFVLIESELSNSS